LPDYVGHIFISDIWQNLLKFANLSCLRSPVQLNCGKYLFKSTRTKFVIEKMHLPPDLGAEEKKPDSANKLDF
jgi:hypothetical protein